MAKSNDQLEAEIHSLERKFEEYVKLKNEEERQRLRTALMAAGGIILALGSFLWWEVIWPALKGIQKP